MLQVRNAWFAYPRSADVLKGISLSIEPGTRVAIAGENGSGKTTLARLLCGLLRPVAGAVTVDDVNTADPDAAVEVRSRVGIVFQDPDDQLVEVTVEREIGFGPKNLGLELGEIQRRVESALKVFGIEHLARRPCHLLSAGEKQTVTIASIFAMQPDYVILDESTTLLDAASRLRVLEAVDRLLAETGAGLGFVSMRLEDIWTCDEVVFLKEGRFEFMGSKEDFLSHLEASGVPLYGLPAVVAGLERSVPGLAARLAKGRDLTAARVAEALLDLGPGRGGGKTRGGRPGSGKPGGYAKNGSGKTAGGGEPCP